MAGKKQAAVVILDFGAINAQMAARAVRDLHIYCEVLPVSVDPDRIAALQPKALVLQRGEACGAPARDIPEAVRQLGLPMLDLQTARCDAETLRTFLIDQCKLAQEWTPEAFIEQTVFDLREQIGEHKALLAMSGGVDSSVCAALLHKAIGDQLTCVFVDHGFMRKNEPGQIAEVFRDQFGIRLLSIDARDRFMQKLRGITDPEAKRKVIGEEFIRVFEDEARALGELDFFVQGTIYPDIIESGREGGKAVKAHHNVGGLPERIDFKGIVEPVRLLFKDEVRAVGDALGIPSHITRRQPFPGPGLAVRCLGELSVEKLDVLREADAIFCGAMADQGYAAQAGQYFAVLTNVQSVGVTDDERTYGHVIALRAVRTVDFMTACPVPLPMEFLIETAGQIAERVPGVSRVVYDITGKPPATIEWE